MIKISLSFFILGLSFGLGPCLSSCGPLLLSYSAGTQKSVFKSLSAYFIFSLSRIMVYAVLSLLVFFAGQIFTEHFLGYQARYIYLFGGIFVSVIGLLIILGKNSQHKYCGKLQEIFLKKDLKTVILFGLVTAILPCAGLITMFSYIGLVAGKWISVVIYSLAFGLGTACSPLLMLAALAGFIPRLAAKKERFYRLVNLVCGIVILILGIQLILRGI